MSEKIAVLRKLVTADGHEGPIELVDGRFHPVVHHALKENLRSEISEIARIGDEPGKPAIRSYELTKQISAILLIYKENYRR